MMVTHRRGIARDEGIEVRSSLCGFLTWEYVLAGDDKVPGI